METPRCGAVGELGPAVGQDRESIHAFFAAQEPSSTGWPNATPGGIS
jgi:hypothetical protein